MSTFCKRTLYLYYTSEYWIILLVFLPVEESFNLNEKVVDVRYRNTTVTTEKTNTQTSFQLSLTLHAVKYSCKMWTVRSNIQVKVTFSKCLLLNASASKKEPNPGFVYYEDQFYPGHHVTFEFGDKCLQQPK